MLICYYLGAVLMLSDGSNAYPITSLNRLSVHNEYLQGYNYRDSPVWFAINPTEANDTVDQVLQTCDTRAHDPAQHQ
jgi:hypothetical protein